MRRAVAVLICLINGMMAFGEDIAWPALPKSDAAITIPAQTHPRFPSPRSVQIYVRYPKGAIEGVTPETGILLSLHNWGGTKFIGAPDPARLVDRYNLVVIGVDYLQSGKWDPAIGVPYDFGVYQAVDALRALQCVVSGLRHSGIKFDESRIYSTGGSGGGNVTLMANKLAPRTFACVIDISGMARLSDDIAYGDPAGSELNAGYSREPDSPNLLTAGAKELRDLGHTSHLARMRALGGDARVVILHGAGDNVCPTGEKRVLVQRFMDAGYRVAAWFPDIDDIDGKRVKGIGHGDIGDRTDLLIDVADAYLNPTSPEVCRREYVMDFDRGSCIQYEVHGGTYVIHFDGAVRVEFVSTD